MVVTEGDALGDVAVEVNPSLPDHTQLVASVEFEFNNTVPPTQTGPLLLAPVDVGRALTVTVVV